MPAAHILWYVWSNTPTSFSMRRGIGCRWLRSNSQGPIDFHCECLSVNTLSLQTEACHRSQLIFNPDYPFKAKIMRLGVDEQLDIKHALFIFILFSLLYSVLAVNISALCRSDCVDLWLEGVTQENGVRPIEEVISCIC